MNYLTSEEKKLKHCFQNNVPLALTSMKKIFKILEGVYIS